MSRSRDKFFGVVFQIVQPVFSQRPVYIACLAEPASPDAAPLNLKDHPVLSNFEKRNKRFLDIGCIVQGYHQFFGNLLRRTEVIGKKGLNGSVFFIGYIIKSRNIDSRNPSCLLKKFETAFSLLLIVKIDIQKPIVDGLPFPDIKKIEKFRQGFRVVGAGAAADDDRVVFSPLAAVERNPT